MIHLELIRHGQPEWAPGGHCVNDPDLTELGRAQAQHVAESLAAKSFDGFYVSPLKRAVQTAAPIAQRLQLEPRILPWLAELGHQDLEGRPEAEATAYFAELTSRELEHWWHGPPGGEPFRDFDRRVCTGMEALLAECGARPRDGDGHRIWDCAEGDQQLLIVAHGGTIGNLISHLLDIDNVPWMYERFKLGLGGICRLATSPLAGGMTWNLRTFNEREHLRGLPDPPG